MIRGVANLQQAVYTAVMDLEALAHNLRMERLKRGWTMDRLQAESGVDKGTISRLERKLHPRPSAVMLGRLGRVFDRSAEWLGAWHHDEQGAEPARTGVSDEPILYAVPLVGGIHAGRETTILPDEDIHWGTRRVYKLPGNQKARWIVGDCMDGQDPDLKEGDLVFIDPDLRWEIGDVLALEIKGGVHVKKIAKKNGELHLTSRHGPMVIDEEDTRIMGVVISWQRTIKR
jgi:transcriptional regulator with XRE-family HTH domain